jgi:hypothetical protein
MGQLRQERFYKQRRGSYKVMSYKIDARIARPSQAWEALLGLHMLIYK